MLNKKEKSIIRIYEQPVLPALARILFWMMLILLIAMLAADVSSFIRYGTEMEAGHLFYNICITGVGEWFICCIFLVPVCMLGMRQNEKIYRKRREEDGITVEGEEEREREKRTVRRQNETYLLYRKVCLIGLAVWMLLFAAALLFYA
ncbi:hypothetical protein H8S37_05420 [Mediterraneibacter sp. NSJ-55]|uniref:Uncharacterized protein n=1 Tax=Mediterraneibacter hominis TaxID=2763054 RepID=A0A923RRG7_9FIRM|nr:hypothetical protein [Mediterraneibacter hominis]MBC5688367.1 hypothetical protein [Mediterraneibacter hominis]